MYVKFETSLYSGTKHPTPSSLPCSLLFAILLSNSLTHLPLVNSGYFTDSLLQQLARKLQLRLEQLELALLATVTNNDPTIAMSPFI